MGPGQRQAKVPVLRHDPLHHLIHALLYGMGALLVAEYIDRMPIYGWMHWLFGAAGWALFLSCLLSLRDLSRFPGGSLDD
jgi:hypothetical protein